MLPYDWFMSDSGTQAGRQKQRGARGQGITCVLYWISCLGDDNKVILDQNQHQTLTWVGGRTTYYEDAAGKYVMMYNRKKYYNFFQLYCTNMTIQLIPDKAEFVYHSSQTAFI